MPTGVKILSMEIATLIQEAITTFQQHVSLRYVIEGKPADNSIEVLPDPVVGQKITTGMGHFFCQPTAGSEV